MALRTLRVRNQREPPPFLLPPAILDHPADLGMAGEIERGKAFNFDSKTPLGQGHRIKQRVVRVEPEHHSRELLRHRLGDP